MEVVACRFRREDCHEERQFGNQDGEAQSQGQQQGQESEVRPYGEWEKRSHGNPTQEFG